MKSILRHLEEEDKPFIFSSFLKSYQENYPVKLVPKTLYFKGQADIIEFLLQNARVLVAVYPEDASQIMGYCIYEHISEALIIHYIYMKSLNRKQYIAIDMIEGLLGDKKMIVSTCMTDDFRFLKNKIGGAKIIYDPFLLTNLRLQKR